MRGDSSISYDHHEIGDIPSSILNLFRKRNIFFNFFFYFFVQKPIVCICEFYKLYCDV